jgi:hypothetical protein
MVRRNDSGEWSISEADVKKVAAIASLVAGLLTTAVSVTAAWFAATTKVEGMAQRMVSHEARLTALEAGLRELSFELSDIKLSLDALVRFRCLDSTDAEQRLAGIYTKCQTEMPVMPRRGLQ